MTENHSEKYLRVLVSGSVKVWIDSRIIHLKIDDRGFTTVELDSHEAREVAKVLNLFASEIEDSPDIM